MSVFLEYSECWSLLNVLNEVCYGIEFSDMQKEIGAEEEDVLELEKRIRKEKNVKGMVLDLSDADKLILMNSIDVVIFEEAKTRAKEEFGIPQELWKRVV